MSIPNIKFKTEYCNSWKQGKVCEKGNSCFFAHGEIQLRTIQQLFAKHYYLLQQHMQNHKDMTLQNSQTSLQTKPHNYKTIFCKFYGEGKIYGQKGNCKLGDHCTYAHQRREKRKKRPSQDYNQQENIPGNTSWDSYQLYQYYAQNYMYPYMQPNYSYDQQIYQNFQFQNQNVTFKEEQNICVIQNSNELNNIKEEITFNHPLHTKNLQQVGKENAAINEQKQEKV